MLLTIEYRHTEVNYNIYNIGALAVLIISQNYFSKLSKLLFVFGFFFFVLFCFVFWGFFFVCFWGEGVLLVHEPL